MTLKVQRINANIQRELSLILQNDVRDKNLQFCTITSVNTTNDLSICKVYISFVGDENTQRKGMNALEKSKGYLRTLLAKKLKIRKVPELHFLLDTSLDYGNRIENILKDLNKK